MKVKRLLLTFLLITVSTGICFAQDTTVKKINYFNDGPNETAAGILMPAGAFSSTHYTGFGVEYSRSLPISKKRVLHSPLFLLATAGISYYLGKKETVSGYPYTYPGYTQFYVYGGLQYSIGTNINIGLAAGPGGSLYNGDLRFAAGAKLEVTYYFNKRWGVKPGLLFIKEPGADPLVAASLKATFAF